MTDLELDSLAEGLLKYMMEKTEGPLDGISLLAVCLLKLFDASVVNQWPIEEFAKDFSTSLIESYKARTMIGPERLQ